MSRLLGDLFGGASATAVALPQSMGLGVVLFTGVGLSPSSGAMAGLLGAAALCLSSGLAGATRGMVSAPNGPVTLLLLAELSWLAAGGLDAAALPLALVAMLVFAGVFQILLGATGGGSIVKYIPFPVVAGVVTSVGILMVVSQLPALNGFAAEEIPAAWRAIPTVAGVVTLLAVRFAPRLVSRVPAVVSGFACGIACFHLLAALAPGPLPAAWVVGEIPRLALPDQLPGAATLLALPWAELLAGGAALAVVASIDCLLTALVADGRTGERHRAGRELLAQGIGQIVAALCGGIGGGGTKGSTLVAIASGGRRWAALVAGLLFVCLLLFLGSFGRWLPLSALAGVIAYVGLEMVEVNILHWLARSRLRTDALVALAVIGTTVGVNLLAGVAVGLVGSVLLFMRTQWQLPFVHERATGCQRRSLRRRGEDDIELLDQHGDRIVYLELRGNLFFGTAERLFEELLPDLRRPVWLVFNLRRVEHIDTTAVHLLRQMAAMLRRHGGTMVYANVHKHIGGARKMNKAFRQLGRMTGLPKVKTFASTDAALEFAENRLLREVRGEPPATHPRVPLAGNRLLRDMQPDAIAAIAALTAPTEVPRRALVFEQRSPGSTLYLIERGEVEIRLATGRYHYKRLAKIGAGDFFGEGSFLRPGRRSAAAVVTRRATLHALDREVLDELEAGGNPRAARALIEAVARGVVAKLHWTRAELDRLERN